MKANLQSVSLENLCGFVAIQKTYKGDEVLRQILAHSLTVCAPNSISNIDQFRSAFEAQYGLKLESERMQRAIDRLMSEGIISRLSKGGPFVVSPERRALALERIDAARQLEADVMNEWFEQLDKRDLGLDASFAWRALHEYLRAAFRRHGLGTISLIDQSFQQEKSLSTPLNTILNEAVEAIVGPLDATGYKEAIRAFFREISLSPIRSRYVVQLADSAFSFYTLAVPPEISEVLRSNLPNLSLFLDTNFLFGLLDLHEHAFVEVSKELVQAVQQHHLPFLLYYHEATQNELARAIAAVAPVLLRQQWPPQISRIVARNTDYVSGLELKYHQRNAESPVDAEDFLRPLNYIGDLLAEKEIRIYRPPAPRLVERANLEAEYRDFLIKNGRKEKPPNAMNHDMAMLDAVFYQRSASKSSLQAGALCVTCDYGLYLFDMHLARKGNHLPCVVLPNLFYQLIRPYIPADANFDASFAQTFAIPEFRTLDSHSEKARAKMLSILASFKDINEGTAASMLANDLLSEQIRDSGSEQDALKMVEAAIATDNDRLIRERDALALRLKDIELTAGVERSQLEQKLTEVSFDIEQIRSTSISVSERLAQEERKARELQEAREKEAIERSELKQELLAERERAARDSAASVLVLENSRSEIAAVERRERRLQISVVILVTAIGIAAFE
jgi:hypothetical protein